MAQIDGAGQQDTADQNAEALQEVFAQPQVTLQGQPQGGRDVPSHQNSDPVSDESEILGSRQPLTGKRRVPWWEGTKSEIPMEWFIILLIVVPALIALVIWDVQSKDTLPAPSFSSTIPRSDATRPVLIGLAVATLLGWGLFLYAELDKAENQRGARREIRALSANEEIVRNQIAQMEQSAGSLADLQNK